MTCFLIHLLISLVRCAFHFFISSGERGLAIIGTLQRMKGNKFDVNKSSLLCMGVATQIFLKARRHQIRRQATLQEAKYIPNFIHS